MNPEEMQALRQQIAVLQVQVKSMRQQVQQQQERLDAISLPFWKKIWNRLGK